MKKILVIALAIVLTLSVVAFAACEKSQTVTGECHYSRTYGEHTTTYGAKVDVTVKGGVITAVKLYEDAESGYVRTTATWKEAEGQLGHDKAEAAYEAWINKVFVGKTVAEVNAYKANVPVESGNPSVETAAANLAGATQSAARIIVAVQDALSKLAK